MNRTRRLDLCLAVPMPATVIAADSPHAVDRGQPDRDTEHLTDDDGGPRVYGANPPTLILNPRGTADHSPHEPHLHRRPEHRGLAWRAALGGVFSGTTPGEIIERCPHADVVVSTSGDGGDTWKEVLAIDPDGPGPLKAHDPRPWIDPDGRRWVFFTLPYPLHQYARAISADSMTAPAVPTPTSSRSPTAPSTPVGISCVRETRRCG
jgi:hypothetical protein